MVDLEALSEEVEVVLALMSSRSRRSFGGFILETDRRQPCCLPQKSKGRRNSIIYIGGKIGPYYDVSCRRCASRSQIPSRSRREQCVGGKRDYISRRQRRGQVPYIMCQVGRTIKTTQPRSQRQCRWSPSVVASPNQISDDDLACIRFCY